MKNTGMVRLLDHLGRIVIPIEIRNHLNIELGDPIEFLRDEDNEYVVLQKSVGQACKLCRSIEGLTYLKGKNCFICYECSQALKSSNPQQYMPTTNKNRTAKPRKQRKVKEEVTLRELKKLMLQHPGLKQKGLAELLGISQSRISQLKKKLT
ncbi:hypothetical protein P4H71_28230 [Paenibacillus kribbensis]|uniref:AbrB/MazE/SpoVT family DNA-binding domain-containing protein n=1 Tax=Paenibacillus kribbensis TaxID=172713 RepID=UPI002DBB95B9|nr:AbrB/MazE/SpoVT family DNA-binding domain-containing protein [Paenibacillus kribbensis]MEC0238206.1 hypothetical protein [Paenibacillus kribbensis]